MSIDVRDYLIEQAGLDWAELLAGWSPPLPPTFTLWLVNRFGDVFAAFEDGSIHMLDVNNGSLTRVAASRDDFADQIDKGQSDFWLMIPVVDKCVAAGLTPSRGQCYRFKIPPFLGGNYDLGNIFVGDLREHYAFTAGIFRQTKNLPNSAKVRLVIGAPPADDGTQ